MADIEFRKSGGEGEPAGCFGKAFFSVFFFFFFAFGVTFIVLMLRDAGKELRTYSWKKTDCTIVSSGLEETRSDSNPYQFNVEYAYDMDGRTYRSGTFYATESQRDDDYGKIYRLTRIFAPDTKTFCYVNDKEPKEAVLRRQIPWFLFAIPLPLIFVAVGLGGLYFAWRSGAAKAGKKESISSRATGKGGKGFLLILFGAFLLIGGGILFGFFGPAALKVLRSRSWNETPCTVLSSRVRSHRGDDSTTYNIDIVFSYEIDGTEYRSNRYTFLGGSSSGRGGKAKVVRQHPRGKKAVCYVNPNDPWEAVLNRKITPGYLFGLIPLVFFVVGFVGLRYQLSGKDTRAKAVDHPDWMPAVPVSSSRNFAGSALREAVAQAGPVILKPKTSPIMKVVGALFFALFWNGIVSVFVWQVIQAFRRGDPEWFLTVFMIPFVLVGLGAFGAVFYYAMACFNPRPTLRVGSAAVPLGGVVKLNWEMSGQTSSVDRLRISLEGIEEAVYQRGTRTYTDTETFAEIDIVETTESYDMMRGEVEFRVPSNTMHSFEASHNKIVWAIKVHADIRRWPDVKDDYPFVVLPMPHSQGSRS